MSEVTPSEAPAPGQTATEGQAPARGGRAARRGAADGSGPPVVILSTQHVRDLNTSRILQTLRENGPLSRAQLAAMSGVRRGTMGAITRRLIELNILEEHPSTSDGKSGRPATPLWFGTRAAMAGAIAIRHDELEVAVVNARGDVLARNLISADPDASPDSIDAVVLDLFQATVAGFGDGIVKIGVSIPGVCDHATGEITACPQMPGLVGTHLAEALQTSTGLETVVDDDSHGSALGEQWFGVGRGHASFITVQTGFGIGAGIVIDGMIIRGPAGMSTEVGHTCVDRFGEMCHCGLRGCWETIASTQWVRHAATEAGIEDGSTLTVGRLAQLSRADDRRATRLLWQYAENLSVGLANLAQALCVRQFILQGDAIQGGETLRRQIETETRTRVFKSRRANVTVELSQMADRAGVFGAAAIALASALPVRA